MSGMLAQTERVRRSLPAPHPTLEVRRFTVEPAPPYVGSPDGPRWSLRCFGPGRAVICRGVPSSYPSAEAARAVGETWIETGLQPADQPSPLYPDRRI